MMFLAFMYHRNTLLHIIHISAFCINYNTANRAVSSGHTVSLSNTKYCRIPIFVAAGLLFLNQDQDLVFLLLSRDMIVLYLSSGSS